MRGSGTQQEDVLSHLGPDDGEPAEVSEDTHDLVAVGHTAVNFEVLQVCVRVELHALENRARLERVRLHRRKRNVRRGRVSGQACDDPLAECIERMER